MTSKLTAFFGLGLGLFLFSSCTSAPKKTTPTRTVPARMALPANEYSAIAEREIVRRQSRIKAADDAAYRAAQQSASGNNEAAIEEYSRALGTLPADR